MLSPRPPLRRQHSRCSLDRIGLAACILLTFIAGAAAGADTDYGKLCQQRLGKDHTGSILYAPAGEDWEIIAVGAAAIDKAGSTSPADAYRQAQLIAGAAARQLLAEFVGGAKLKGYDISGSDIKFATDSSKKTDDTTTSFKQFFSSQQRQDVQAFVRGSRVVGEWLSADGSQAFAAVGLRPSDVKRSISISDQMREIEDAPPQPRKTSTPPRVVKLTDESAESQASSFWVRVIGTAARGNRSASVARWARWPRACNSRSSRWSAPRSPARHQFKTSSGSTRSSAASRPAR